MSKRFTVNILIISIFLIEENFGYREHQSTIMINDPNFGLTKREYIIYYPEVVSTSPPGLFIFLPGWTVTMQMAARQTYKNFVDEWNFILIYPNGMNDVGSGVI